MNAPSILKTMLICSVLCVNSTLFADTPKVSISASAGKTLASLGDLSIPNLSVSGKEVIGGAIEYAFNDHLAVELQTASGTVEFSMPGQTLDVDVDSTALYLVQRSVGQTYIKVKIGILKETISGGSTEESATGLSYGIGGGYSLNEQFSIEGEYIKVEEDISWILISGKYSFGL